MNEKLIDRYLSLKEEAARIEREIAEIRPVLAAADGAETKHYRIKLVASRREYVKSMSELKERFTPTQLKGLIGVSQMSTLRITRR